MDSSSYLKANGLNLLPVVLIFEYFSKARMLVDTLAAIGILVFDKELATYLLNGLGLAYETLITTVTTRLDPISSQERYQFLLIHENRIAHSFQTTIIPSPFDPSANITTNSSRDQRGK